MSEKTSKYFLVTTRNPVTSAIMETRLKAVKGALSAEATNEAVTDAIEVARADLEAEYQEKLASIKTELEATIAKFSARNLG